MQIFFETTHLLDLTIQVDQCHLSRMSGMETEEQWASEPGAACKNPPVALTIAGSDSGGGAGIQADLLTFRAFGVFGTSALTCITAQSPRQVSGVVALDADFVFRQITEIASFFSLAAVKTGMLFNRSIIEKVAEYLAKNRELPAVVDPVMVAASGARLLEAEAVEAFKGELLPLATVITPNLDEVEVLLGRLPENLAQMQDAAQELAVVFQTAIFLKGGHLQGPRVFDILCQKNGRTTVFEARKIEEINTHGSGCTIAAAIAAALARGSNLQSAVKAAHSYLQSGIERPLCLQGEQFISH